MIAIICDDLACMLCCEDDGPVVDHDAVFAVSVEPTECRNHCPIMAGSADRW